MLIVASYSFPFLTETDLLTRWEDGVPDSEEPSYLLLMTVCAISSQTAALGAVFDEALLEDLPVHDSDWYYDEAVAKVPPRIVQSQDLDYLRSFGLLAVYSLQSGNQVDLQRYLGLCHAFVAQHSFHDEHRWPADLSLSDVDDRRRMFWCLYRLELHSACTYGHMVRMPESQASVLYPRITPAMDPETQLWTAGWDYITDLFRLLEYAIFSLRGCKTRKPLLAMFCSVPPATMLLESLSQLKGNKPRMLQDLDSLQGASHSNRCQYMAVQIVCSETLVTIMSLLYCQASANEIMEVAKSFLDELTKAPLIMFRIAGSQIVHQLLGVGHMVYNASFYEHGRYWPEAKRLLAFLGDLVKTLENDIPSAVEAGERFLRLANTEI